MPVAYNPYDPRQQQLLGAISLSEVGNAANAQYLGTGFVDLSDAPRNEYGFPIWSGTGNSRAAGFFQFQPGTWEQYAEQYDLNFQDANDQKAAAWYLAQDTYRKEKGGELVAALEAGKYSDIESALGRTQWIGARGKLAQFLSGGKGAKLPDGTNAPSEDTSGFSWERFNPFRNPLTEPGSTESVGDTFVRVGLIVVGVAVILVAIWRLLSDSGAVPSAGKIVKGVTKAAGAVA